GVGKGSAMAVSGLEGGRSGSAAQSVGIARRALELARAYAKERRQFGRPIADFEGLRFSIAKAESDLAASRLLALRAAWLRDRGRSFTREAAMAKLYASEMAQRATHAAVQILGGNGYMRDYAVERYARDGRATTGCRESARNRGAPSLRCTAAASGRCGSSRDSARPRTRTSASTTSSNTASTVSRSRSTCRRSWAAIRTTHSRAAKSGARES